MRSRDKFHYDATQRAIVHEARERLLDNMEELYVFVSVSAEGKEGLCGYWEERIGGMMPMVCADPDRLKELTEEAGRMAAAMPAGVTIKLLRFSTREVVRTIRPNIING